MYNLADPAGHRRGLIRACGDAAGVDCTAWVYTAVCAAACDGASGPSGDVQPVPSTTLSNRRIALHVDDRGMAWGTVENGTGGDDMWLDRSWDEGASRPGGSSLGRTSVASGAAAATTRLDAVVFQSPSCTAERSVRAAEPSKARTAAVRRGRGRPPTAPAQPRTR